MGGGEKSRWVGARPRPLRPLRGHFPHALRVGGKSWASAFLDLPPDSRSERGGSTAEGRVGGGLAPNPGDQTRSGIRTYCTPPSIGSMTRVGEAGSAKRSSAVSPWI